jgi:hypothetical protein
MGTLAFGTSLVGVFKAEDGIQLDGASVAEVQCTADTDTDEQYAAGDIVEHGQVSATLLLEDDTDVQALVGTTDTLTYTLPAGDTYVGQAFLVSAPLTASKNTEVTRATTFRWTTKPTYTAVP